MIRKLLSLDSRMWISSTLNVIGVGFGLLAILQAGHIKGQSPMMYSIFLFIQVTYAESGYKMKIWPQFWGMSVSAVISIIILTLIFLWR